MPLLQEQNIFMAKIIALNKPFGVICQFSGDEKTLAEYIDIPNIYPVGRLDKDSEGLVILTDDGKLQNKISHPKYNKTKTYVVQVEGEVERLKQDVQQKLNEVRSEVLHLGNVGHEKGMALRESMILEERNTLQEEFENNFDELSKEIKATKTSFAKLNKELSAAISKQLLS